MIAGLGNPGLRYQNTRHNLGFDLIDRLSESWDIPLSKKRFQARFNKGMFQGVPVILTKPDTYMNLSGKAVLPLMSFYRIPPERLMVIHDDIDLAPGKIRLKLNGGDGGHRGIRSLIDAIGGRSFVRVRLGVGRPDNSATEHVLLKFNREEKEFFDQVCKTGVSAVETVMESGLTAAMNKFNTIKQL
ncbi:MAG: aminoacyl-tRNA hydrolase [bacterium]